MLKFVNTNEINTVGTFIAYSMKWMLNITSTKPSIIRCDNGKEVVNRPMISFLEDQGIQVELTVPYLPEMNGVAERMNRSLKTKAATIFLPTGTSNSKIIFDKAVEWAVYLKNRIPGTNNSKTTFELLFNRPPDISRLKKFGSDVLEKLASQKIQQLHLPKCHNPIIAAVIDGYTDNRNAYQCWYYKDKSFVVAIHNDIEWLDSFLFAKLGEALILNIP